MQPLYNHWSQDTAYLVDDYPYGRSVRCRIRYWVEHKLGRGWRFVSQTENPRTLVWNKPRMGTYAALGGCLYLDEVGHVHCRELSHYSSAEECLAFARDFPGADLALARTWALDQTKHLRDILSGALVWTVNRRPLPVRAADRERQERELAAWIEVARVAGESTSEAFRDVSAQLAGVAVDVAREPVS